MKMTPLLSIVIATKNRVPYCIKCIEAVLKLENVNIELVIQDNTDNFELRDYVSLNFDDKRLVYQYTPPPFSSIDNFNAALELATGEYVCMIGDDDGINPEILKATLWAKDNNVDALVGSLSANYRWALTGAPNTLFTKMTGNSLTLTHFKGNVCQPNIENSLNKLMKNGCTNYSDFSLPKLYHGVIRRECLELIKRKTGSYLKGLSPDIYSSIALSCVINKLITIDYPLTIPGVCEASTSVTEGQIKKHSKKIEDAPHFRSRGNYIWSKEVPRIYCVQTIWADSGFAALREMERFDLIKKFNKHKLFAHIIFADFSTTKMVINHIIETNDGSKLQLYIEICHLIFAIITGPFNLFLKKRFFNRLLIIIGLRRLIVIEDLTDINMAMNALEKYLVKNVFDINNILLI